MNKTPESSANQNDLNVNVYRVTQLNCIVDGEELSWREVKKAINNEKINEIKIFGISNKLYKEIIRYLNEEDYHYTIYERARIVLT